MSETRLAGGTRLLASSADAQLGVGCFRLKFDSDAPVRFSDFPGSAWRGALGHSLAGLACTSGARYLHLALDIPEHARGRELAAEELERFGAGLEPFLVEHELCASGCVKFIDAAANGQDRE